MDNYILLKLERSSGVWSSLWEEEDGPYMLESLSLLRNSGKQDMHAPPQSFTGYSLSDIILGKLQKQKEFIFRT